MDGCGTRLAPSSSCCVYRATLVLVVAIVAFAPRGRLTSDPHARMDPVSHSDYELHRSIGHTP